MGAFSSLKKLLNPKNIKEANVLLSKVTTAEDAVKLVGPDREAYLKALDLKYGPSSVRSLDLGFGKQDWYHGTTVPIDQFEKEALGSSTGAASAKRGFFFAQDPSTASDYADLARDKGISRPFIDWQKVKKEADDIEDVLIKKYQIDTNKDKAADFMNAAYEGNKPALRKLGLSKEEAETLVTKQRESRNLYDKHADLSPEGRIQTIDNEIASLRNRLAKDGPNEFIARDTLSQLEGAKKNLVDFPEDADFLNEKIAKLQKTYDRYAKGNLPPEELDLIQSSIKEKRKIAEDLTRSQGQNVLPVRLRSGEGGIGIKNYGGESYRDSSYAELLDNAQKSGKSGMLFKNTYDPADHNNAVKQNIAAVFEPNQIRSKFAAFDPRFKDSPLLMAGTAGAVVGGSTLMPDQAEASTMSGFNGIKKMFQVGGKSFPASNAAEAMKIKNALEQTGQVGMNRALVATDELAPVANEMASAAGQGTEPLVPKFAAGFGMTGGMNAMPDESSISPFELLKKGMGMYKENVVDPIAEKAKKVLTPDMNVQGSTYKTSSPGTDMIIEGAADPINYIPGVGGAVAGAAQVMGDLAPEDEKFKNTKRLFGR